MKTLYTVLVLFSFVSAAAQNVGIGTTTPQAPFHIRSLSAVEMLRIEGVNPYISFFNGPDYSGYLWYNSNKMELGTPSGSGEPVLIAPGRIATAYFTTTGRVGIGIPAPAEKLDVAGNINLTGLLKINGSGGTAGQVLTSNGTADPEWKNAAYNNNTRFCFNIYESLVSTSTNVNFSGTRYNLNTADVVRNPSSITINKSGLYHFDLNLNIFVDYDAGTTSPPSIYLEFSVNGSLYEIFQGTPLLDEPNSSDYRLNRVFSIDLYITAPTTITLPCSVYYSGTPVARYVMGQFTGYLISE